MFSARPTPLYHVELLLLNLSTMKGRGNVDLAGHGQTNINVKI